MYKLAEKIFCVANKNPYRLAMFFLRYQEFYESNNPDFKGKQFTIVKYMDWYANKYGKGLFSYPDDFAGFNIPQTIIKDCIRTVTDLNEYDIQMDFLDHHLKCQDIHDGYIIGVPYYIDEKKPNSILKHEFAHGLYRTSPLYRASIEHDLLPKVPKKIKKQCAKIFENYMYDSSVHEDEMQAYFSTGILTEMRKIPGIQDIVAPFQKNFKSFFKDKFMKVNGSDKYHTFNI